MWFFRYLHRFKRVHDKFANNYPLTTVFWLLFISLISYSIGNILNSSLVLVWCNLSKLIKLLLSNHSTTNV